MSGKNHKILKLNMHFSLNGNRCSVSCKINIGPTKVPTQLTCLLLLTLTLLYSILLNIHIQYNTTQSYQSNADKCGSLCCVISHQEAYPRPPWESTWNQRLTIQDGIWWNAIVIPWNKLSWTQNEIEISNTNFFEVGLT